MVESKISVEEKRRRRAQLYERQIDLCAASFEHFLFNHVLTKDEHDPSDPIKAVPDKAYIRYLARKFQHGPDVIYVAKSRQLMVSWILCALAVWKALYHPQARVCFQSKKLEDAAIMIYDTTPQIARASFIIANLPEEMRFCISQKGVTKERIKVKVPMGNQTFTYGNIKFPNGSLVEALAQGAAQVEGKVPSLFISDESSLQEEWRASWTAMRPCIAGGGRAIAVATMRLPSAYGEEISPCDDVDPDGVMRGIAEFQTVSGGYGIRVHYSADPAKDPKTPEGAVWYVRETSGENAMLGGAEGAEWRQHMEIDPTSRAGTRVLPMWERIKDKVVVPDLPVEVLRMWRLDSGFDWGVRNKTVWQVFATNFENQRYMVHEMAMPAYDAGGVPGIASRMKAHPLFSMVNGRIKADPTIWNDTQSTAGGVVSNAVLFQRAGVHLTKAKLKGQEADDVWLQKLVGYYWAGWEAEDFVPRLFICQSCTETIAGLPRLMYQDWTAATADKNDLKERFVDKRNDWLDAWKYTEVSEPGVPSLAIEQAPAGSFQWLLDQATGALSKRRGISAGTLARRA